MSDRTALYTDDLFLEHRTGSGHPETHHRLISIRNRLEQQDYYGRFRSLEAHPASEDDLLRVHTREHIDRIQSISEQGGGHLDGDTPASPRSYDAALLAAGAGTAAGDAVISGEIDRAVLLVRPPGHHALQKRAMGFCLFNNIAICARHLQSRGTERIAILDWDVHHGNGTEATFYEDAGVLFVSLHQYPFYPGTGAASDTGRGAGAGTTLNLPMVSGSDDGDYRRAFQERVLPALEKFQPQTLLISAGFDGHFRDPLGGLNLSTEIFEWMTRQARDFAAAHCRDRIISFLEGGYDLEALADSVEAHAAAML